MKRVMRCNIFIATTLFFAASLIKVNPARAASIAEFNIDVAPVLSVSMSNVNLEATVGALATGTGALSISSNNATGYNTFITSSSAETALIDLSEEYQIPSITTTTTASNFPTNAWGMSVDGTNYDGITPLDSTTPAISTLSPSTPSTITQNISFATKVDATTPAGTYSNSILVTVVPNYVPITLTESYNLAGKTRVFGNDGHKYYSMQDMNPTICSTADKEHSSIQVVDERDGKVYWITKLKDGNCWMTQNLDFDITEDNVTPELSDVKVAWNSSSTYVPQATTTTIFSDTSYTGTYSYDPGSNYIPNGTGTPTAITCTSATNNGENCHYHQGNYYQYNAATAGTGGGELIDADATSSICPKGWRLPTSNSDSANYSFGNLVKQYGYSGSNQTSGVTDSTLLASPLFFARGGDVYSGSLSYQGSRGYYWSSRVHSDTNLAYYLNFYSSYVNPSYNSARNRGFSVRCVAHGNILSLTYNANGGTNAPSATIAESNTAPIIATISSTIPTKQGYKFLGYANASDTTAPDYVYANWAFTPSTITLTTDKTIYAVWEAENYTITWDANGGSVSPTSASKQYGTTLDTLPTPTYAGHNFGGWFTAASGGTQILATTTVTGDVTYYAHWTVAGIAGLGYMQDITPTACANTAVGTQTQLIDSRDNKLYWVAKLADGNCWMTQNLDYDIKSGDNIVSNLDGTTSIWNGSTYYAPQATATTVFNDPLYKGTFSYDPGSKYLPNGTGTPTAITCTSTTNGGENCHYHQGNYYQYNAAVAGTGGPISNADATSSICPKGWRLPTSNSASANYSFGNLVKRYGYSGSDQFSGVTDSTLLASPLFFARGGFVNPGSLYYQGSYGYYWSSRAYSDTLDAYALYFGSSFVYPSNDYTSYSGYSVRCVAL